VGDRNERLQIHVVELNGVALLAINAKKIVAYFTKKRCAMFMKRRARNDDDEPAPKPEVRQWLHQAQVFKALGHFGRMAIVHALAGGKACACDLAAAAGCSPSTVLRHLLVLRHAGLIVDERCGQQIFYRLRCPCVLTFAECLNRLNAGDKMSVLRVVAESQEFRIQS